MDWNVVIGIEVHIRLCLNSKLFSASASHYGADANMHASGIDLALPGTLPVANTRAFDMAIMLGLDLESTINPYNVFARKNYFYPDLPKGYQITQMDHPIIMGGHIPIDIDGEKKDIHIHHAHLEEDAGKLIHQKNESWVDYNRAGTTLIEVVTEPNMASSQEAVCFLKALRQRAIYLGICDGNMEQGSFKFDINISLRKNDASPLGTRTEIKNLNSFRFVERAIEREIQRQGDLLESGRQVTQATCLYDPDRDETRVMRSKEDAHDYRYFPDPDLLPVHVTPEWIARIQAQMPEKQSEKIKRFCDTYHLKAPDATRLTKDPCFCKLFESCTQTHPQLSHLFVQWILGDISALLNEHQIKPAHCTINAQQLVQVAEKVDKKAINRSAAKIIFSQILNGQHDVDTIIDEQQLGTLHDTQALSAIIESIIHKHPNQVEQYQNGEEKLWGYFMGQIMKKTKGQADLDTVKTLLKNKLTLSEQP